MLRVCLLTGFALIDGGPQEIGDGTGSCRGGVNDYIDGKVVMNNAEPIVDENTLARTLKESPAMAIIVDNHGAGEVW